MDKIYSQKDNSYIITPSGYLDLYNIPEIQETMADLKGTDVVIECDDLRYMDSAVIRFFARFADILRETGNRLIFVNLKDYMKGIVNMVGLTDKFVFEYTGEDRA